MFASLLSAAMNVDLKSSAHPSFVDIIKSMNSDDARVLSALTKRQPYPIMDIAISIVGENTHMHLSKNLSLIGVDAKLADPWSSPVSLINLERMGLCEIIKSKHLSNEALYTEIQEHPAVKAFIAQQESQEKVKCVFFKGAIELTSFGESFVRTCLSRT